MNYVRCIQNTLFIIRSRDRSTFIYYLFQNTPNYIKTIWIYTSYIRFDFFLRSSFISVFSHDSLVKLSWTVAYNARIVFCWPELIWDSKLVIPARCLIGQIFSSTRHQAVHLKPCLGENHWCVLIIFFLFNFSFLEILFQMLKSILEQLKLLCTATSVWVVNFWKMKKWRFYFFLRCWFRNIQDIIMTCFIEFFTNIIILRTRIYKNSGSKN